MNHSLMRGRRKEITARAQGKTRFGAGALLDAPQPASESFGSAGGCRQCSMVWKQCGAGNSLWGWGSGSTAVYSEGAAGKSYRARHRETSRQHPPAKALETRHVDGDKTDQLVGLEEL